jgi:hypothetical protein
VSKHVKLWTMNVFNERRPFHGFDTMKFLLEDEGLIKDLENMLSSFVLYVAKQNVNLHLPTKYNSLPFLESFYKVFFFHVFFFFLFCLCFYKLCVFFFYIRFKVMLRF